VKTTPTDAHLARIFYSVLIEQARSHPGQSIRYKELLNRAKRAYPNDEVVQSAIPIGIGRRLEVIVQFVRDHHLPPLTCLAVNESGHPGASYRPVTGSWQTDMDSVARYDWAEWHDRWETHIDAVKKAATPLKRRTEKAALELVHQAFLAKQIPRVQQDVKAQLVELLKDGLSVEDAARELHLGAG